MMDKEFRAFVFGYILASDVPDIPLKVLEEVWTALMQEKPRDWLTIADEKIRNAISAMEISSQITRLDSAIK